MIWNDELLVRFMNKFNIMNKDLADYLGVARPYITYFRTGEKDVSPYSEKLTAYYESVKAGKLTELSELIKYYSEPL